MMCFTRLVLVALTLAAAGKAFAGSNPSFKYPTGSKQTTVSATTGRTAEQGSVNGDGRRLILPVDTPAVKVNLFGREYSVKERRVCLPVRIVEKQKQGVAAFWDSPRKEIVLTQQDYDSYMRKYEKGGGSGTVMDIVRHEGIHASVSQEFGKLYEDESGYPMPETSDWYHFLHEMLAYVGGDGMSEKNAAKQIMSACAEEEEKRYLGFVPWYQCSKKVYPDGSRGIAEKFLNGEPYTPPEAALNTKDQGDNPKQVSMNDLMNMDLDDENGDWCKCESPGCIQRESEEGYYVAFQCMICRKINVKFAKKAIELEAKFRARGIKTSWLGPNAEEKARSAAGKTN